MKADILIYITILLSVVSFIYALISMKKSEQYKKEKRHLSDSVKIIQESTCFNITEFSQFSHMADQRHRKIKECLASEKNTEELSHCVESFMQFFTESLARIFNVNIQFIERYFLDRGSIAPSIQIKFLSDEKIHTLYSNNKEPREPERYSPQEDTGIYSVVQKGMYYLNNDIGTSSKHGTYKNVRNDFNKFYNSTMIVPISLISNALSEEFITHFNLNISAEAFRVIYGFICIDHKNRNYFDQELDVHIGNIFSEYFLLYLILQSKYVDQSQTFQIAMKLIKDLPNNRIKSDS